MTISSTSSTLRRWLLGAVTLALFAVAVFSSWAYQGQEQKRESTGARAAPTPTHPWPMFGGTNSRNLVNLIDRHIPIDFSVKKGAMKKVKWMAELGSKSYGGPVVADGKVFVGTNNEHPRDKNIEGDKGIIMCFRESDGKFLWQRVHDKLPAGRVQDWPEEGICSSPVVEGQRVYYVSNRCMVHCCTTDGKTVWELDMIGKLGVFPHNLATCSPLIAGDILFVITSNGVDDGHINIPAPQAPSYIAINKKDGKVLWQNNDPTVNLLKLPPGKDRTAFIKELVDKGQLLMHGQWSNPVYAEVNGKGQIIFPGGDGWIRGYEPETGKLIWKFDCNPKSSVYRLGGKGTRNDFVSTPVVHENRLYIGVGQDPEHEEGVGHFWCIDLVRATEKGRTNKDNDVSPVNDNFNPADPINKDSALAWHYGEPAAPSEKIPDRDYVFGRTLSTAAVHDGLCYVAELAGYLHCLDAKTGKRYWYANLGRPTWSSPYVVDGKVLMGTDGKKLHIFAHGKELRELAVIPMYGFIRATPVVANGVLFVMTENRLYAIR